MHARMFVCLSGCCIPTFLTVYMLCHISLYVCLNRNFLKFILMSTVICVKLLLEVALPALVKFS
jgi:hypothetical protein